MDADEEAAPVEDHRKEIVEIVRNAAGKLAETFETLLVRMDAALAQAGKTAGELRPAR